MVAAVDEHACWTLPAVPDTVRQLRAHVTAFAAAAGAAPELQHAVALAVSETVTNAIVHAYAGARETGTVRVCCWVAEGQLVVEVADDGAGMARREDSPGVGHGLAMVGAVAEALDVAPGRGGHGTAVTMTFAARSATQLTAPGLKPLCRLALETVADVSCVDLVRGGVLRRAAAEVAGDVGLSAWLRNATPPAKPGTATWAALREGGAHLVVHDPTVARSPGGTGEILGLSWWVAIALDGPDGAPAAIWGLGGRAGGRAAPSPARLGTLANAARGDLADKPQRAALRARLGAPHPKAGDQPQSSSPQNCTRTASRDSAIICSHSNAQGFLIAPR
jgi:anti-sigma regulatory factor (Ser/Thr protein kinase)/peptidoglycan hydrolase-like protein with peptidoglycan-binding domain